MGQHHVFLQWQDRDPVIDRIKNGVYPDEEILVSRVPVKDEVIRLHRKDFLLGFYIHREEGRSGRVDFVEWVEIDHLMEPVLFLDH